MIGKYYESINLLTNFERINFSSSSILYLIKSKFKLLQKCINMRKNGLTKNEIINNKKLKKKITKKLEFKTPAIPDITDNKKK